MKIKLMYVEDVLLRMGSIGEEVGPG